MRKNSSTIVIFIALFLLIVLIFIFRGQLNGVSGILSSATRPLQSNLFSLFNHPSTVSTKQSLQVIYTLTDQAKMNQLKEDNNALRDQFATSSINPSKLLPAKIIGLPQFVPGISLPEQVILDQGANEGIQKGMPVVVKNVLIGEVAQVEPTTSLVTLTSNPTVSFTAQTQNTQTLGIVRGEGADKVALVNVELSDNLKIGDIVVTKGDKNLVGQGLPPGLVIGKITAINKSPSALYQSAAIQNPVNITRVSEVFVMLK